jgi:hypothetical protein
LNVVLFSMCSSDICTMGVVTVLEFPTYKHVYFTSYHS